MANDVLLWILGIMSSVFFIVIAAGIRGYTGLLETYSELASRVTRLEAVMSLFGEKAAKILHSPHDPYGIDSLLDKYLDRYYELSWDEWQQLLKACEGIENDCTKSKDERTLAAWIAAVASHKLHIPPTAKRLLKS